MMHPYLKFTSVVLLTTYMFTTASTQEFTSADWPVTLVIGTTLETFDLVKSALANYSDVINEIDDMIRNKTSKDKARDLNANDTRTDTTDQPFDHNSTQTTDEGLTKPRESTVVAFRTELVNVFPETNAGDFDQRLAVHDQLRKHNVSVFIGRYNVATALATEKNGIPYLCVSAVSEDTANILPMIPDSTEIESAILSVINAYEWSSYAIIYDDTLDPERIHHAFKVSNNSVKMWALDSESDTLNDDVTLVLNDIFTHQISNYLIVARTALILPFMEAAGKRGMLASPSVWVVLNLRFGHVFGDIMHDLHSNVTLVTLLQTPPVLDENYQMSRPMITLSDRLIPDSVGLVLKALINMLSTNNWRGNMVDIITTENELAEWRQSRDPSLSGIHWNNYTSPKKDDKENHLKGQVVKIVSILEKPFLMPVDDATAVGNARYQGFFADLMRHIADIVGFEYQLYITPDNAYGGQMENGEWNGIMGQILTRNASIGVGLVETVERTIYVDFTKPFMTSTLSLLVKTPEYKNTYFQFLNPLTMWVWIIVSIVVPVISLVFYLLEKYSVPMQEDVEELSLRESIWFIFAAIIQGDTERVPGSLPARILISAWWFFILIVVSSYTANLAAFLTRTRMKPPISGLQDLSRTVGTEYGVLVDTSAEIFFKNSELEMIKQMWQSMNEVFDGAIVENREKAMEKIRQDNFVLIADSIVNDYVTDNDCDFTSLKKGMFMEKGYGLTVARGTGYLEELSVAILKLVDDGTIGYLRRRWWTSVQCDEVPENKFTAELSIENLAGIFFILLSGIGLSILVLLGQRAVRRMKKKNTLTIQPLTSENPIELNESSGHDGEDSYKGYFGGDHFTHF